MNADDVLKPDALEKMIMYMQENDFDWVNCYGEKFGAGEGLLPVEENVSLDRIKQVNVLTSFAMMKKSVWDEAHGYDENLTPEPYKAGYEDWDLWIRLIGLGKRYGVIHEPLYLYRIHDSQFGDIASKESIIREILFNKHK
jgi:GT2 family glycosyltransferase